MLKEAFNRALKEDQMVLVLPTTNCTLLQFIRMTHLNKTIKHFQRGSVNTHSERSP